MNLPPLDPQLLYMIVLGPGLGESILIRIPPNEWIVIDCFTVPIRGKSRTNVPLEVLKQHKATASLLLLTHRHQDHTAGFSELIETSSDGCLVACSETWDPAQAESLRGLDAEGQLKLGNNQQALAAILDCWERSVSRRFSLVAPFAHPMGEATLTLLHPDSAFLQKFDPEMQNEASSPLLLEWKGLRLLLGADLEKHWPTAASRAPNVHLHAAFKVSHHASLNGLDNVLYGSATASSRERLWVATPWNLNQGLPNFQDSHGPAQIHKHLNSLHLTALPFKNPPVPDPPLRITREDLRDRKGVGVPLEPLVGGIVLEQIDPPEESPYAGAWICGGFAADGSLASVHCGGNAVVSSAQATASVSQG